MRETIRNASDDQGCVRRSGTRLSIRDASDDSGIRNSSDDQGSVRQSGKRDTIRDA